MHRGLYCWLVLGSTLSFVIAWPVSQPNSQQAGIFVPVSHSLELCNDSRCSCSHSPHVVKCQCSPQDQEATLDVYPSSVPRDASLIVIRSCRSVIFHEGGIKHLSNLSIVTVEDAGEVVFHSGSFNQLKVERKTSVTIGRCRQLVIKTSAFVSHSLNPVSLNSSYCHAVRIEESAFSRLNRLTLTNIQFLYLASHAFRFITGSPLDEDHIKTEIFIEHVNMTELKSFTFPSPLDRLLLENVTILDQIHANATSALRIVQLSIYGSRIGSIAAGAFSEFTHLDSLEIRSTQVGQIAGRAFSSAASFIIIEGCKIGRMNQSALSMPVARVSLHSNHIDVLATGALYLREWNQLLIENNTVALIERHAFYNIGEPKLLPSPKAGRDVRFIIRNNKFHQVQLGAFIISAEVPQLKLEANYFHQNCDCQMAGWAAQLTQITRRTETTTSESLLEEDDVPNAPRALWLGSSLFNSSLCQLDQAAAECLDLIEPEFLSMKNYTDEFCSVAPETEFSRCLATKRSLMDISRIIDFEADDGSGIKLVDFSSRHDLVIIIVLSVLCALVFLAVCLGFVIARFKTKTRQEERGKKTMSNEERVTCSPLIPNVEKQLGSGVVSSGSISRLSVKEYRNYLEDLGPIYSEPLEPPEASVRMVSSNNSTPPDVPAMPVQWTPKSGPKTEDINKRTIDRGTQTLEDVKVFESENFSTSVQIGEPASSLALEFTEDVMAALRDKMDVSPMYSEVKDSIVFKEDDTSLTKGTTAPEHELYDLIKVVDGEPRPSTSSARSEHIYCKPWNADPLKIRLPSSVSDDTPSVEFKVEKNESVDTSSSKKPKKFQTTKSQPFHVRGSLPKWPPPVREGKAISRNRNGSKTSLASSPPASPVKDTKTPSLQNSSRSTPARKLTHEIRNESNASQKTQGVIIQSKSLSTMKPKESTVESNSLNVVPHSPSSLQSKDCDDEYAQVTPQPFSFSFRRPLFTERKEKNGLDGPPKPARSTWSPVAQLCEYADPRDLNEPLYSELIVQDEQQHDSL